MNSPIDKFIDEIYSLESNGILSDLFFSPHLFTHFLDFDESRKKKALEYITSVLKQCYSLGQLQVAASYGDDELYGYAMIFTAPQLPKYIHKIFVKEEFRGHGIGSQIISSITETNEDFCLLCPSDTVKFYEKYNFEYMQQFDMPEGENFKLSRGLYLGLCLMTNYKKEVGAPIFLLNDQDIKKIIQLC